MRENDVSGTTSAENTLAMFRRQSRGYARGTFLLAQAIDKTMLLLFASEQKGFSFHNSRKC
jgi:hypothetical protein